MRLEELKVYQLSMEIGEEIWSLVSRWRYFEKETIGKQLVRSADSISANLSEGFGRYHFKESKNFYYYARGSLFETKTWLKKSANRSLIEDEVFQKIAVNLDILGAIINNFIKTTGNS